MQTTTALYKEIWEQDHAAEVRLIISGIEYLQKDIVSVETSGGLFSAPGIGNCSSRQIDLEILPRGNIPRQAKIQVYVRLKKSDKVSEWIQKGEFFISRRQKNKRTGSLTITGYDAMLKAEQIWLDSTYADENWPMTQANAVADIARRMGVEVDGRTRLSSQFPVDYPVDENGDLTMREVLGFIAVSNAGNWIITDRGNLLLVKFGDLPKETSYLVSEDGDAITFGGDRILV